MPLYRLADRVPQTPATDRYWVAPDANVIGSVILAEDVGIWFGATLRGDNDQSASVAAPIFRTA